ncbi:cytochrome P450 [Mycena floridula]|nr:cytochrome P450 [Mycena floridula]
MALLAHLSSLNLFAMSILTWILFKVIQHLWQSSYATPLRGPTKSPSFWFGYQLKVLDNEVETATLYENWAAEYGSVFSMPWLMGGHRVMIMDPKAIAHCFARGETVYTQPAASRATISSLFGHGILTAEGDVHRRQRKSLNPSFSPATIRGITSMFYDAGYKSQVKAAWDLQLDADTQDFIIIDVQKWMTSVALDSIGMGGFSHDFGTLTGKRPLIETALESFGTNVGNRAPLSPLSFIEVVGHVFPVLLKLPIGQGTLVRKLKASLDDVGTELVDRVRKEQDDVEGKQSGDRSVIGTLIKSAGTNTEMHLTQAEIQGQMVPIFMNNTLLVAGYVTTAASMTWALIELAKSQDKQAKLREELLSLGPNDPTYDELSSPTTLPYLDAIVHEILRFHPPVPETPRMCTQNDILPLSAPITTRDRKVVSSVAIPKGTLIAIPIRAINTSEKFWGPDAKEFRPERWLESDSSVAKDIQSYRHILTFISGPRECLGKTFALTEFKSVLSVMIRNFTFDLPDGPETKIGEWKGMVTKPNVEGQVEGRVPMIVRRVD